MKKKAMILAVCLALVGMLAVNGTLAQTVEGIFQTITFALGLVDAPERDETQLDVSLVSHYRQGGQLVQGSTSQSLVPMAHDWEKKVAINVGGTTYQLWEAAALDKFTAVKNVGSNGDKDAYFRLAFAVDANIHSKLKLNFTDDTCYAWTDWTDISIGGRMFKMIVATYTEALAPGQVSPPALLQVAMDKSATNEDYAKISSDFLQIKAMAVDADALTTEENGVMVRPGAQYTLDITVPLREGFNPF